MPKDQVKNLYLLLEESQNRNTAQLGQILETQKIQAEHLKELVGLFNKSIKIQTAMYKMEKEAVKGKYKIDED